MFLHMTNSVSSKSLDWRLESDDLELLLLLLGLSKSADLTVASKSTEKGTSSDKEPLGAQGLPLSELLLLTPLVVDNTDNFFSALSSSTLLDRRLDLRLDRVFELTLLDRRLLSLSSESECASACIATADKLEYNVSKSTDVCAWLILLGLVFSSLPFLLPIFKAANSAELVATTELLLTLEAKALILCAWILKDCRRDLCEPVDFEAP